MPVVGVYVLGISKTRISYPLLRRIGSSEVGHDIGRFGRPTISFRDRNLYRAGTPRASRRRKLKPGAHRGYMCDYGPSTRAGPCVSGLWRFDAEDGFRQRLPRLCFLATEALTFVASLRNRSAANSQRPP